MGTQSPGQSLEGAHPQGGEQSLAPLGQTNMSCEVCAPWGPLTRLSLCIWGWPEWVVHRPGVLVSRGREHPRTFWFDQVLPTKRVSRRCEGPGGFRPPPPMCHRGSWLSQDGWE